jgi:hypothetical protein
MNNASYIGTLLVENIKQRKKGSSSIELIISYNKEGELLATAYDLDKPYKKNKAMLVISMPPDNDNNSFEGLEFEPAQYMDNEFATEVKRSNTARTMTTAFAAILILLAIFGLWSFMRQTESAEDEALSESTAEVPPVEVTPDPVAITPAPVEAAPVIPFPDTPEDPVLSAETPLPANEPVAAPPQRAAEPTPVARPQTRASRERPAAPVTSINPPAVIPSDGIKYRLRWGDTLWDVSQAFYRTPWYYRYIARHNGIRNPDRIVSGSTITIPPPPR